MRVAALYDVHGNLPALEAVLADVDAEPVDVLVCGGDVCAGPMPRECLDLLRDRGALFVRGNADRELVGWPAERLPADDLAFLRGLPLTLELDVGGLGRVLFCHGSPRRDDEIITSLSPEERVAAALTGVVAGIVVCGHTHVQYERVVGGVSLVNAGSVGVPYEREPGAYWLLLDDAGPHLRRTELAVAAVAARVRATGYPGADGMLVSSLLEPVGPDAASAHFEGLAGAA